MVLAIDAGNTQVKLGVFDLGELVWRLVVSYEELLQVELPSFRKDIERVMVSSVGFLSNDNFTRFAPGAEVHFLNENSTLPFVSRYVSPKTLGSDRLAAVAGAYFEFQTSCLVVDVGTALTCDVIHRELGYLGGSISPGVRMRLRALHDYTARLPNVRWDGEVVASIGTDTASCMLAGCLLGIVGEIDNFALRLRSIYEGEEFKLVVTGGDAHVFHGCAEDYYYRPDLVMYGLHGLLGIQ